MLRVQYYTNYNEWPDSPAKASSLNSKVTATWQQQPLPEPRPVSPARAPASCISFTSWRRRGTMEYYTPFPGQDRLYHASIAIRDFQ